MFIPHLAPALLEERCFPVVDIALRTMPDALAHLSEIKQQLRHRILLADGETLPRIAQYSGRGALHATSELGQRLVWPLSILSKQHCHVLHQVWAGVNMAWAGGRIVRKGLPDRHACR